MSSLAAGSRSAALAAAAGLVALPVAAWWVSGDMSYTPTIADTLAGPPDYMVRPLPLSASTERAAGATAVVVVLASALLLVVHARQGPWDRRWFGPLAAAATVGVIVGFGWRVMTAGVIGANIGAGLMIVFAGPMVLVLLGWAAVRAAKVRRTLPGPSITWSGR